MQKRGKNRKKQRLESPGNGSCSGGTAKVINKKKKKVDKLSQARKTGKRRRKERSG